MGGTTSNSAPAPAPPPAAAPASASSSAASGSDGVTTNADVFGPACAKLPTGNAPGSLDSMGPQPVGSAASTNPLLKKLVAAVTAANLVDPLNSAPGITVFAPADDAFKALGDAKFTELANNPAKLAPILKYHVASKRYDAKGLADEVSIDTLDTEGGPLKIEGSGENITVNGNPILCGNIPTKNATVFVIGKVLTPGTNKS
ncbi:fasciclin domain-containing protein [Amycolatopsis sp. NPDC059657]|uniref:fasciclin domain-containing protein n=1 Tax=Amycolatopsis sp. NPDC059657 TaxID=3346899 RepID=UPI003673516A